MSKMTIDEAILKICNRLDDRLSQEHLTDTGRDDLGKAKSNLEKIKEASISKGDYIVSEELSKLLRAQKNTPFAAHNIREAVDAMRPCESVESDKQKEKPVGLSKGKRRAISITVGAISGLFFMAIGLICAFCWLKTEKDTVYFVIESLKDIIGGLGVGTFTSKSISKNGKQTISKFVSVVSFALLGISALGVIVLIVFACLALFSKETYIYFEICFMILSFIGLCCVIFNNPDKKSATAN